MSDYGFLARVLHRVALGPSAVRRATFDLDQALGGSRKNAGTELLPPVLVFGLARSGSSILLRLLDQTGAFASLTYRDMPFVLAPRLWRRFRRASSGGTVRAVERAHGDGLRMDEDTAEAFEEVFWMTFQDASYVGAERLSPHEADVETRSLFRDYVAAVVASAGNGNAAAPRRYLSKNNNNLLRAASIRATFPDAHLLVPFRDPLAQAHSLRRQHHRFSDIHRRDPFGRRYMSLLGHFEFGLDLKVIDIGGAYAATRGLDPDGLAFWLAYWTAVYGGVLEFSERVEPMFVDHDRLRSRPGDCLAALSERLGLEQPPSAADVRPVDDDGSVDAEDVPADLLARARDVHARLGSHRCAL